jgi:glutathione synthase/RimK-type ligase-like ATP-grasp enzyme
MKYRVYPYRVGSRSASLLAKTVGGKVLKREGSTWSPKTEDVVINWGSSLLPGYGCKVLNRDVSKAGNKLLAFQTMEEKCRIPDFWTEREGHDNLFPVVCRQTLTGHSGEGIVIANSTDELVDAPLYTRYIKKKDEYRVHVMAGKVFFIQRKARKMGLEANWQIRNLEGGFVFVEVAIESVLLDVITQSIFAVQALSLDFGGVDILWNGHDSKAYVLEINTACGLEERTALKYKEAFYELQQWTGNY